MTLDSTLPRETKVETTWSWQKKKSQPWLLAGWFFLLREEDLHNTWDPMFPEYKKARDPSLLPQHLGPRDFCRLDHKTFDNNICKQYKIPLSISQHHLIRIPRPCQTRDLELKSSIQLFEGSWRDHPPGPYSIIEQCPRRSKVSELIGKHSPLIRIL